MRFEHISVTMTKGTGFALVDNLYVFLGVSFLTLGFCCAQVKDIKPAAPDSAGKENASSKKAGNDGSKGLSGEAASSNSSAGKGDSKSAQRAAKKAAKAKRTMQGLKQAIGQNLAKKEELEKELAAAERSVSGNDAARKLVSLAAQVSVCMRCRGVILVPRKRTRDFVCSHHHANLYLYPVRLTVGSQDPRRSGCPRRDQRSASELMPSRARSLSPRSAVLGARAGRRDARSQPAGQGPEPEESATASGLAR